MTELAEPNSATLRERVDAYYWHHSIDLGNGVVTKGATSLDLTNRIAASLFDGIDLNGKSLLDIGAWNGAYSFEAKRRGCKRVLASDKFCWTHPEIKGRHTFDLALEALGLDVETLEIDVPDIAPASVGVFDAVLFSGVFYHLINPVHLTRQISACARHLLVLETHQDLLDSDRPGMIFYPGRGLAHDDTNWWGPNPQAVYEILREIGFTRIFYQDSPQYEDASTRDFRKRGTYYAFRDDQSVELFKAGHSNWLDLEVASVRAHLFAPLGWRAKVNAKRALRFMHRLIRK
jgi:tRNA (mo5U34)-methyltransferase